SPPQACSAITVGNGPSRSGLKSCARSVMVPSGMSTSRGAAPVAASTGKAAAKSVRNAMSDLRRIWFLNDRYGDQGQRVHPHQRVTRANLRKTSQIGGFRGRTASPIYARLKD